MKDLDSKMIIGFINQTIKGHTLVFGQTYEDRGHKIITAIIGDMDAFHPETKKVIEYCQKHYNYPIR